MSEPLDLKALDHLERQMPRIQGHVWITQGYVDYIGDSLRPMLDLVQRLGKTLENMPCNYRHPVCKALYPKVPERWCARCRGLEYYQQAGGE